MPMCTLDHFHSSSLSQRVAHTSPPLRQFVSRHSPPFWFRQFMPKEFAGCQARVKEKTPFDADKGKFSAAHPIHASRVNVIFT